MKIKDIIDQFIAGDWGEETCSNEMPCAVTCVRGADIIPISEYNFSAIPIRYISRQSYSKKCLHVGDIIIEKSGGSPTQSTGRVSFVSQELLDSVGPVVCSNFCTAFRVKKGWNPLYVYYYFQFIYNLGLFFNFEGKTSGLKNLQLDAAFAAIPIKDVSESAQNKIVAVLQGLEKKIALNRRINQNLEAMAKQLYDYWFVQFDFPDENGRPYKSSGGKMVWNEKLKREIPEGWDSIPIGNYAPCKGGYAFKSSDFCKRRGVPVIKIGNIRDDYTLDMTDCQCIENFDNSQFLAKRFDLVIAMTGATIGKFAISQRDYWVNQRVGRFELGDTPLNRLGYLFNSLKQDYFREQIFQIASGCAQPNISSEQIDAILILKPKDSILSQFNNICRSLLKQQSENLLQIEELTKQRDELLPLLMNGQVSVNSDLSRD